MQTSDHSPRTFSSPRRRNWRKPRACLIWAVDRFDDDLALGVDAAARPVLQFASHTIAQGRGSRDWSAWSWRQRLIVLVPVNRDEGLHAEPGGFAQVFFRTVSAVGQHRSGPGEGTAVAVVVLDELVDACDQFAHAAEAAAPDGLLGDQSEPALHLIEPRGIGRGVVDVEARPLSSQVRTVACL